MDEMNNDFYTKSEVNNLLNVSATADTDEMQRDFYTKSEVDQLIDEHSGGATYVKNGLLFDLSSVPGFTTFVTTSQINLSVTTAVTIEWHGTLTGLSNTDSYNPTLGRLFAFRAGDVVSAAGFEALIELRDGSYYLGFGVNNQWIGGQSFINHFGEEIAIPLNTEITLSITVDSAGFNIYKNGALWISSSTYQSALSAIAYTYMVLMANTTTSAHQGCAGNVKALRLYNRALTAAEIQQNYSADTSA